MKMVFQGFSFFAMALVSVGVIAYHIYKNREAYFYDVSPSRSTYSYLNEPLPTCSSTNEEDEGVRKRKQVKTETCSICMESVQSSAISLPPEFPYSAISLPCKHLFHTKCVTTWLDARKTCPNCRAPAFAAL